MGSARGRRWAAALAVASAATGLVAMSGFAGTGGAGGEPAPAGFRLADGSAGCRLLSADELACRAAGADTGVVLHASGASSPERVDAALDPAAPVLLPAQSWWNGPFSCRTRAGEVVCSAGGGAIAVAPGGLGGVR
jgi:hypothetical protein